MSEVTLKKLPLLPLQRLVYRALYLNVRCDVMVQTMSKAVVDEVSTEVGKRLTDEERVKKLVKLCFLRTKPMAHHNSRLEMVQAS